MKKLIICGIGLLMFVMCTTEGTKSVNDEGIGGSLCAKKFKFDGHTYIEFKDYALTGHGFVHDPECSCLTKNK